MAKDTGKGSRVGSVTGRTQVKNPKTGHYVTQRNAGRPEEGPVHGRKGRHQTL